MTMLDMDAVRRLPGAWSAEEAGRFTPKGDGPTSPYQELYDEGPAPTEHDVPEGKPLLQKASSESPYAELYKEGPSKDEGPQAADIGTLGLGGKVIKEAARGALSFPALAIGGLADLPSYASEAFGGPSFRTRIAERFSAPDLPANATGAEKAARIGGTIFPGMALGLASGAGVLGTLGGTGAALAGGPIAGGTAKALGVPERAIPLIEALGGLGAGIGGGSATEAAFNRATAPTKAALRAAGKSARQDIRATGVTLEPQSTINDIIDRTGQQIGEEGKVAGASAWRLLNTLRPVADDDGRVPIGRLLGVRTLLGKMGRERDVATRELTPNAGIAQTGYGAITDYIKNLPNNPHYIVDALGDKSTVAANIAQKFDESNQNYAAAIRSGNFMRNVYNKPMQKVSSTYTSGNAINQVRQGARYMLDPDHPERISGWKPEEVSALNGVLHGVNPIQNLARAVGVLGPGSQLSLWAAGLGGASALAGNPAGLVLPAMTAIGWGARKIGQAAQRRQINLLDKQLRMRSPLGQAALKAAEHGGNAGAEEAGGVAGFVGEELPEFIHHGAELGSDLGKTSVKQGSMGGSDDDDEKKKDTGGYSMGHRLLKAVGGYDGNFFKEGGYDNPQGEQFADPQAFRLRLARLAAMPQTGIGGGSPMPSYQVGGYDWPWSMKGAKSRPEPVDTGGTGSKYLFGSFSTVSKPHPPKGGASMQDPQGEDVGGYDDGPLPMGVMPQPGPEQAPAQPGITPQRVLGVLPQALKQGLLDPWVQNIAASIPGPTPDLSANAVPLMRAIGQARIGLPARGLPAGAANALPSVSGLLSGLSQGLGKWRASMPNPSVKAGEKAALSFSDGSVFSGANHQEAMQAAIKAMGADNVDQLIDSAGYLDKGGKFYEGPSKDFPELGGYLMARRRGGYGMGQVSPLAGGGGY